MARSLAIGAQVPDWEPTFLSWSKPSSDTEQAKMDNAVDQVGTAIKGSTVLKQYDIRVFPQGSYRNNTNVRLESDVDVCVMNRHVLFTSFDFAKGFTKADAGLNDASYRYAEFKNDVQSALVNYFGRGAVTRGDKAFDIKETSTRVEADVVATFTHRRYTYLDAYGAPSWLQPEGTEFISDSGVRIRNWPEQHYANGVAKNTRTGNRFKYMVRILKRLGDYMETKGVVAANNMPSYLVECLVWNASDAAFGHSTYTKDMREVLAQTFNGTLTDDACYEWLEVNELKYLFRATQPWTRAQAHAFLSAAWNFVGFQ
jgi:hypothetical protein